MAGPDNVLRNDDGVLRARIEAGNTDPVDLDVSITLVTIERERMFDKQGTDTETFPVVKVEGFQPHDRYRLATPGTSWLAEDIVDEKEIARVDSNEFDL